MACGGTVQPAQSPASSDDEVDASERARGGPARSEPTQRADDDSESRRTEHASSSVGVRGITGSLSSYEVEQAMGARHEPLLACVKQRPRALGHVSGNIAFRVEVDPRGKVERVDIVASDLGYAPLEACLSAVLASTPFPVPAGAQRAEATWSMGVEPLQRAAEWIDAAALEPVVERQVEATYERCSIPRQRRFVVNGYVGRSRKLQPLSVRMPRAVAQPSDADVEQLACLSHELETWTGWPKAGGVAKVGFELRWVAAPAKQRGRSPVRAKRR